MFSAAARALSQIFSPPFRKVLFQSLVLAIALIVVLGAAGLYGLSLLIAFEIAWLDTGLEILAGLALVAALVFLIVPVATMAAGLFLEDIAAVVEARDYPNDPEGENQPFWQGLWIGLKFTAVVVIINLMVLPLYLLPGVNVVLFWIVNGYLLGREFFELVALRHMSPEKARAFRREHRASVFAAGVVIALPTVVPILNLLVPLFGTAFMVHIFKRLSGPGSGRSPAPVAA